MSRPTKRDNRDFKLADDDSSTNDFINSVAKNAPRKKTEEKPVVDRPANNEPWTSDVYTRLNGAGDSRRAQGHNCFSILVFGFSVILLLAGAALIVVAAIEKDQKLLPICPACDKVMIGMYAVGGFVILVGIVGILASRTRTKALAVPYCFLLSILALAFLGLTILVVVFITNTNGLHLNSAWETEVRDDPNSICDLQAKWECSGFNTCCNGVVTNDTTATTTTVTVATNITDATSTEAQTTTNVVPETTTAEVTTASAVAPSLNRVVFRVAADNDTTTVAPTDAPTTATDASTTATDAPTTATDAPTTVTDAPTTVTDAPTTATDAPTTATDAPTTATVTDAFTTSTAEVTTESTEAPTTTIVELNTSTSATTTTTTTTTVLTNTTTEAPSFGNCFVSTNGEWPQQVKDQCVLGCNSNVYQNTCDDVLHNKLKDNLGIILAVLIPATLIIIVMAFFSIRMTRVTRYLE